MGSGFNPWVEKLSRLHPMSSRDAAYLDTLIADYRVYGADEVVRVPQGARALVIDGFVCRMRGFPDGRRQITACLLPGDLATGAPGKSCRDTLRASAPSRVAMVSETDLQSLVFERPQLAQALFHASHIDMAIMVEWSIGLGRRDALERTAHFLCELHARLSMIGLASEQRFDLPLSQSLLADALGLSAVHINRTLKRLSSAGLVRLQRSVVEIPDLAKLEDIAGFDASYLGSPAINIS